MVHIILYMYGIFNNTKSNKFDVSVNISQGNQNQILKTNQFCRQICDKRQSTLYCYLENCTKNYKK